MEPGGAAVNCMGAPPAGSDSYGGPAGSDLYGAPAGSDLYGAAVGHVQLTKLVLKSCVAP